MKASNQTNNLEGPSRHPSTTSSGRVLTACLALAIGVACVPSTQAGVTITTEPSSLGTLFPSTAEIIAATPSDPGLFGDYATTSLAQTVQSGGFDLQTIYLRYNVAGTNSPTVSVDLTIFTVDDVAASSLAEPPPGTGTTLLTETLVLPDLDTASIAAIQLDSPLTLAATAGTTGYAIHIATAGSADFQWYRTGATAGDVYAGGVAYEDGSWKNSGARDFVLALSSSPVPEPSSIALAGLGALFLLGRAAGRRTR